MVNSPLAVLLVAIATIHVTVALALAIPKPQKIFCPKVNDPHNGKVSMTGLIYSSIAYYRCDYGYELDGPKTRECQHNGSWLGKAPICREEKRKNCPTLHGPKYGNVRVTGYSYSSIAYYSCDHGYELQGSHSRKCQHDGTWDGQAPACHEAKKITCPELERNVPEFGKVSVTGYSYSSIAYYSCDYGYELHGLYSRKCQHDGSWFRKAPTCIPVKKIKCPNLHDPKHGKVYANGDLYSSTAYYSCDFGFELQGLHSRKCQHDGSWFGKEPTCHQKVIKVLKAIIKPVIQKLAR